MRRMLLGCLVVVIFASSAGAESTPWQRLVKKDDAWFRGAEGRTAVANLLSHQSDLGDWPKNLDTSKLAFDGDRSKLKGTFDNSATIGEVHILARAYRATGDARAKAAVEKSIDHILKAQYPNGGFPQSSPPGKGYPRRITLNDGTMVHLLELLRDVGRSKEFSFLDETRKAAAQSAFDRGIACLVKCQVTVDGKTTVWCAQHDEVTLEPRPARTFELVSLSGAESADVLLLLMSLESPPPDITRAIEAGARWFDAARLLGIRQTVVDGDKRIVADPKAPPLWARFYEIGTNRPIFAGRDAIKKDRIEDIEHERRNGYAWYGNWGEKVAVGYKRWKAAQTNASGDKVRIVLVGDSTVTDASGWGGALSKSFGPKVEVVNEAKSGRSSRSYIDEGHWTRALARKGDYVLIQFGHNDQPGKGPARETDPKTTYRDFLRKYIAEARAAGSKPVLITSIARRTFGKDGKPRTSLMPYADAVIAVGKDTHTPVIDLHALSLAHLAKIGDAASTPLGSDNGKDRTHFSVEGARVFAAMVAEELTRQVPELASLKN